MKFIYQSVKLVLIQSSTMFRMILDSSHRQQNSWDSHLIFTTTKMQTQTIQEKYPFENHSLNCSWLSNRVGIIKCKRAHSSAMLFWIGVPVSSKRFRHLKLSSVFHRILWNKKEETTVKFQSIIQTNFFTQHSWRHKLVKST